MQQTATAGSDGVRPEVVEGILAHTVFSNEETGWSVVRIDTARGSITAVGLLLGLRAGDRLRLTGRWTVHPRFGEQFEVSSFVEVQPSTLEGIRRFLGSGRIKGLGAGFAARLVEHFGLQTLDVIEHEPERLLEVTGVGHRRAEQIRTGWQQHRGVQQVMVFLQSHDVPPALAAKVWQRYGPAAIDVVRENPYRLAEEVSGVGFLTADRIARGLGLPPDAPQRLEAGLVYTLARAADDGHVHLPRPDLLSWAGRLLDTDADDLELPLERLIAAGRVVAERWPDADSVFQPTLHTAEWQVAAHVRELLETGAPDLDLDVGSAVRRYESDAGIELAPEQRQALESALTAPMVVVTGGPGTGKTTLVRGLVTILERKGLQPLLAAPTGRAAKRLEEATGAAARTIHRLLEFNPATGTFARDRHFPLEADVVVVDEASMVDVELASSLLEAIPAGTRLVVVGDADQLPSVGPGSVLGDLILSGAVPVIRLRHVFRQAQRSLIVVNAHRVNHGQMPEEAEGEELADYYFVAREAPEAAVDTVVELVARRIPERFGFDPLDDVQVLTPMHRGELGVANLNARLQQALNPAGQEVQVGARSYRLGDKVMQLRNNYDLDVYNGDLGRILAVDPEERQVVVRFDGRPVTVPADSLDDLGVAYACTIHKSQGSEYPAVVVVLHHQHHIMLQRNLLYTALTRARRLVVVVGSRRALARAVRNATVRRRHTRLAERLQAEDPIPLA